MDKGLTVTSPLGPRMLNRPGGLRALEIEALRLGAAGTLAPPVHPFPLADAAQAHRALENRHNVGKVVLIP